MLPNSRIRREFARTEDAKSHFDARILREFGYPARLRDIKACVSGRDAVRNNNLRFSLTFVEITSGFSL
jgi:hypothetical protein